MYIQFIPCAEFVTIYCSLKFFKKTLRSLINERFIIINWWGLAIANKGECITQTNTLALQNCTNKYNMKSILIKNVTNKRHANNLPKTSKLFRSCINRFGNISRENIKFDTGISKYISKVSRNKCTNFRRQLNALELSPTMHVTCGKVFGNASALAKHKLTHSDERKYVCNVCSKAFKRQDHLNGHMLTHRHKKPFECKANGCGKSYCDARSLRRHTENHHHHRPSSNQGSPPASPSSSTSSGCIQYAPAPMPSPPGTSAATTSTTVATGAPSSSSASASSSSASASASSTSTTSASSSTAAAFGSMSSVSVSASSASSPSTTTSSAASHQQQQSHDATTSQLQKLLSAEPLSSTSSGGGGGGGALPSK
ncbi:Serine/threonine-protein phosphatase, partial [Aphis craccivora]